MARKVSKTSKLKKLREMDHELVVFDTDLSSDALTKIVRGFKTYVSGQYSGVEVQRNNEFDGMFSILSAGDFDPWPSLGAVRVVGNQIWAKRYAANVKTELEKKGVSYRRGEVTLPGQRVYVKEVEPIDLKLEGKILEFYTVMESQDS